MCHINGIVCIYQKADIVVHLLLVGIVELLKCAHLFHVAGLDTDLLSPVCAVGKYQLQRTAHIEECRIVPSFCLTCLLRLYTSDDVVFPCLCKRKPSAHQRRDDHLIVIVSRKPDTGACKLGCFHQEFMRRTVPHTDGK